MNRRNFLKAAVGAALVPAATVAALAPITVGGVNEPFSFSMEGIFVNGSFFQTNDNWYPGIATLAKEAQHTQNIYWRSILNRRPT